MTDLIKPAPVHDLGANKHLPSAGQWLWVRSRANYADASRGLAEGETHEWLGCIDHIGSNYVRITSPRDADRYTRSIRIHFDQLDDVTRPENDPDAVIAARIAHHKANAQSLIEEVAATISNLGLERSHALAHAAAGTDSNALIALSNAIDPKIYGHALQVAKDKTLPDLFERIKKEHQALAGWMSASLLPMQASLDIMKNSVGAIEDRIFSIELYAGLTESAKKIADGAPARAHEKLHVMQRRLYMDEECLANYDAGGMEFRDIVEFDAWLARPDNRDRILPFPRTFAAFRVRRHEKARSAGSLYDAFVNFELANLDKQTLFYVRNGEQIWRFQSAFQFPEQIAPSRDFYDPQRPMMMRVFADSVRELATRSEYEEALVRFHECERQSAEWQASHPKSDWILDPFRHSNVRCGSTSHFSPSEWQPLDPSSVYYDDASDLLSAEIKSFNRIAVIIQGLFDRSEVLHPHPKVSIWTPDGFAAAIEIVYDGDHALTSGDPPDFEAFRARLNAQITENSVLTGQETFWLRAEAARENARRKADWRTKWRHEDMALETYRPYGNPGPGRVARAARWKPQAKTAIFNWNAERLREAWGKPPLVSKTLAVPASALFNISAYQPGDYKLFFGDPRTRRDYLQWAPLLLTAEDFHAGKITIEETT
ncbi:MAG TPA: hypothetical protein P5256_00375 [Beijerinckiaceae bacterium]|nr:hypothetical protein [Rhodoblastus sp.]MCC2107217.1 hypothetical protein [Hyphomicrobiales bacterium]HRY01551.1 hypothetical protein [Beijerinckiaceae bacterium]